MNYSCAPHLIATRGKHNTPLLFPLQACFFFPLCSWKKNNISAFPVISQLTHPPNEPGPSHSVTIAHKKLDVFNGDIGKQCRGSFAEWLIICRMLKAVKALFPLGWWFGFLIRQSFIFRRLWDFLESWQDLSFFEQFWCAQLDKSNISVSTEKDVSDIIESSVILHLLAHRRLIIAKTCLRRWHMSTCDSEADPPLLQAAKRREKRSRGMAKVKGQSCL